MRNKLVQGAHVKFIVPFGSLNGAVPGSFLYGVIMRHEEDNYVWVSHQEHNGYSLGIFEIPIGYVQTGKWHQPPPPEPVWVPD